MTTHTIYRLIVRRIALGICFSAIGLFTQTARAQSTRPDSWKFLFSGATASGYKTVPADAIYNDSDGFGFEPGSKIESESSGGSDPKQAGDVTSKTPFYFSVKVPEGNFRITLTLGDAHNPTNTTVKAELRRLELEAIQTTAGQWVTRTITTNVRQPEIPGGGQVRLKPRESQKTPGGEWRAWDDKLTLEFSGSHPAVCAVEIEKADDLPTVYLCGDSTVCDQPAEPFNSWGQMLPRWFKPNVVIANEAESGETLPAFYGEKRVDKFMSTLKQGDYVFIQFGHNDMKAPQTEPPEKYKEYYARLAAEAIAHGATPVILTPVSRKTFGPDGNITNSFGGYPDEVRALAKEKNISFIDLQNISAKMYAAIGKSEIQSAFANEKESTHHSDYGSYEIARCVVQAIIDNKLPLADSITDDWTTFDPAHPLMFKQFTLPLDEKVGQTPTPLGN
jgi:lysophospholipase L1-like esterase